MFIYFAVIFKIFGILDDLVKNYFITWFFKYICVIFLFDLKDLVIYWKKLNDDKKKVNVREDFVLLPF